MENVDVEAFGDAPGAANVRELRNTFVEHAGGGECERAVNDVRVAGDPADVGHAPINVFGMNVLVILGGAGDVSEIAASAVLATLWLASGAAGVHEEKRGLGVLRDGLDNVAAIIFQDVVDEVVTLENHG